MKTSLATQSERLQKNVWCKKTNADKLKICHRAPSLKLELQYANDVNPYEIIKREVDTIVQE